MESIKKPKPFGKTEIHQKLFIDLIGFSTTEINNSFLMKLSGHYEGQKYNTLVGVTGLLECIGIDLAKKMLHRAFRMNKKERKEVCKLRSGLRVSFYYK